MKPFIFTIFTTIFLFSSISFADVIRNNYVGTETWNTSKTSFNDVKHQGIFLDAINEAWNQCRKSGEELCVYKSHYLKTSQEKNGRRYTTYQAFLHGMSSDNLEYIDRFCKSFTWRVPNIATKLDKLGAQGSALGSALSSCHTESDFCALEYTSLLSTSSDYNLEGEACVKGYRLKSRRRRR